MSIKNIKTYSSKINPTHNTCSKIRPNPTQRNPWMDATHVHRSPRTNVAASRCNASQIVISLSTCKIRDRDWYYTRHVIWINNQCCPMHQHPGATFMLPGATVPGNITGQYLLTSQALTSLSFRHKKGLKSRFLLYFTYFKEFKNAKII